MDDPETGDRRGGEVTRPLLRIVPQFITGVVVILRWLWVGPGV
jgi:hypothetical protein